MQRCSVLSVVLMFTLCACWPHVAGATLMLKVADIEGESTVEGYEGYIEVGEFGIAISRDVIVDSHGGGGVSRPVFSPFRLEGRTGKASAPLLALLFDARPVDRVELDIVRMSLGDERTEAVASWTLENAFLTSFATEASGDGGIAGSRTWESFVFEAFEIITYRYNELGDGGRPTGDYFQVSWNTVTGRMTTEGTAPANFEFMTGTLVPEPGSTALIGLAATGLAMRRNRR